jgi:N-acetylglucosamine-6-phosphate deacetylase
VVSAVVGGQVLMADRTLQPFDVTIDQGKIRDLVKPGAQAWAGHQILDAAGGVVSPGFIDTHVHGGRGYNFMGLGDGASTVARHLAASGVTSCMATTATTDARSLLHAIEDLAGHTDLDAQVDVLGIHLEGPFLAETHRGVHPVEHLRPPTETELDDILHAAVDRLRIVTLAPELPGATTAIVRLVEAGVAVSLGHSGTSHDGAVRAFSHGVGRVTHCFNGLPPIHHRAPGPIVAALINPAVYIELVADGQHVHPEVARWTWQQIGTDRLILISDGVDVAGLTDGRYRRWEGTQVRLQDGVSRTPSGDLAGGVKGLAACVRDLVHAGALPLTDALCSASETPARSLGLDRVKGRILPGHDADLVVLDHDLDLRATVHAGTVTYHRPETPHPRPEPRRKP